MNKFEKVKFVSISLLILKIEFSSTCITYL